MLPSLTAAASNFYSLSSPTRYNQLRSSRRSSSSTIVSDHPAPAPPSSRQHHHHHYDVDSNADDSPSSSDGGGAGDSQMANEKKLNGQHQHNNSRPNRDPLSHRIIEKRRRDRMNNCLSALSKMIPESYLKKGRGRVEKTEIIEMAIAYIRRMQPTVANNKCTDATTTTPKSAVAVVVKDEATSSTPTAPANGITSTTTTTERYKQGFYDCIAEVLRFLASADNLTINESIKTQLLVHLREYFISRDILGAPIFAQLLQVAQQSSIVFDQRNNRMSSTTSLFVGGAGGITMDDDDEQPLNMSLKKARIDGAPASQLRDILLTTNKTTIDDDDDDDGGGKQHRPSIVHYVSAAPPPAGNCGASGSSSSGQYPSSPCSRSLSSSSGVDSPPPPPIRRSDMGARNGHVPVFALHSAGYYYPLSVHADSLLPIDQDQHQHPVGGICHPVTISVSFGGTGPSDVMSSTK